MDHRSTAVAPASLRSFLYRRQLLQVGMGNQGPRIAQPKAQLEKESLTLAHAQTNPVLSPQILCQQAAIPEVGGQPRIPRRQASGGTYAFQLRIAQSAGATRPCAFLESGQTARLEPSSAWAFLPGAKIRYADLSTARRTI
jgi:hypothetical protein